MFIRVGIEIKFVVYSEGKKFSINSKKTSKTTTAQKDKRYRIDRRYRYSEVEKKVNPHSESDSYDKKEKEKSYRDHVRRGVEQ